MESDKQEYIEAISRAREAATVANGISVLASDPSSPSANLLHAAVEILKQALVLAKDGR